MLDMLIQGGRVVTPAGVGDWDVGIEGEKIVAVAFPGVLPAAATQVIDARGKIVVPGGIETHAHAVANVQPGARTLVAGVPGHVRVTIEQAGAAWESFRTDVDDANFLASTRLPEPAIEQEVERFRVSRARRP